MVCTAAARRASLIERALVLVALGACAPAPEREALTRFSRAAEARTSPDEVSLDGSLDAYVARAALGSPSVRAAFARWEAATHRTRGARRWPRPTLSYTVALGAMPFRERQRVGLMMPIPWPAQLRTGATTAASMADAEAHRVAAELLTLRREIAERYWSLWLIDRRAATVQERAALLSGVVEVVRARLATGNASLAELQQLEVALARLADERASLDSQRHRIGAGLRALLALDAEHALPVADALPALTDLALSPAALREAAMTRPDVQVYEELARAAEARADAADARRWPGLVVGLDWMDMRNLNVGHDDGFMLGLAISLPVDVATLRAERAAARAEERAARADGESRALRARADVDATLADLEDARRQVRLYERTLVPQVEAAHASSLGAYAAGRLPLASLIAAQQELVSLRLALDEARARFALGWARLEEVTGRPLEAGSDSAFDSGAGSASGSASASGTGTGSASASASGSGSEAGSASGSRAGSATGSASGSGGSATGLGAGSGSESGFEVRTEVGR